MFEGIDTYADVYRNGTLILQANNMFRTWSCAVKALLTVGCNVLRLYFHGPVKVGRDQLAAFGCNLPAVNDQSEHGGVGEISSAQCAYQALITSASAMAPACSTAPVKQFPAGRSGTGLYDLCGNVWQWTDTESTEGRTRFVMLRGGAYFSAQGSSWYVDGGPRPLSFYHQVLADVAGT